MILDHRSSWATVLDFPFELLDLFIPVSTIDRLAGDLGITDWKRCIARLSELTSILLYFILECPSYRSSKAGSRQRFYLSSMCSKR